MRLFLLTLSAVAAAVLTSAQNVSPTLTETLDWLKQKADAIHSVERPGIDVLNPTGPRKWEIIYSGRCNVQLKNVTSNAKSYPQMSISFSLSDLNPQRVTATIGEGVFGSQGSVNLYATAGRKVFRWHIATEHKVRDSGNIFTGPRMKSKITTTTPVANRLELGIGDGLARRMANAFQHAITLCGGKPDPKEPF